MFDAISYFENLAEKNRLAKASGFKTVVISGPDNLEGIFEQYRTCDRFIAVTDTSTGNLSSADGSFNFLKRRAYTVFILSAYRHDDMDDRQRELDLCRTLFLQIIKRVIHDKFLYKDQGTYFDTHAIPNQELGRYFLSGMTGLHFTLYVSEPVNLEYDKNEWEGD